MPLDITAGGDLLRTTPRHEAARLAARIRQLAIPRRSGTEGAERVEATIRGELERLGYATLELPFSFSTWPGRFGLPAAGAILSATGVAAALLLASERHLAALSVLGAGIGLALLPLLALAPGLRRLPWGRVRTANLLFTRPETAPSWIVMAHRDTKSQAAPTLVRAAALAVGGAGWLGLAGLATVGLADVSPPAPAVQAAAGVVIAAGLALTLSWAGNRSPGALDNGSGLSALLAVAEAAPAGAAFLVTDGEELGLAGSRDVASRLPAVRGVINIEGLDEVGTILLAEGHGPLRRGSAPRLAASLLAAGEALGIPVARRRLPRSILVDHQPIAAAGIPALTVLRGGWRSLLRVHRPADTADRLDGRGAAEAATLISAALRLLQAEASPTLRRGDAPGHSPNP